MATKATKSKSVLSREVMAIIVVDRGWVYIGLARQDGDWLAVAEARQITRWGTKGGLNELVEGPTKTTVLGVPADVLIPMRAVITVIPVTEVAWEGK